MRGDRNKFILMFKNVKLFKNLAVFLKSFAVFLLRLKSLRHGARH